MVQPLDESWGSSPLQGHGSWLMCEVALRAASHTRLIAHDHYISTTLVGGKGGPGPSSLHTMLERPMEHVNLRWMYTLHGFLHGIKWIMFHGRLDYFQKPPFGGRPTTKLGDHGTPNAHNCWYILFYHAWGPAWIEIHWNSIWLRARSHMTSHFTWRLVTTKHDFGGVLGESLDTFFGALKISWSWLLAHVWSGPNLHKKIRESLSLSRYIYIYIYIEILDRATLNPLRAARKREEIKILYKNQRIRVSLYAESPPAMWVSSLKLLAQESFSSTSLYK